MERVTVFGPCPQAGLASFLVHIRVQPPGVERSLGDIRLCLWEWQIQKAVVVNRHRSEHDLQVIRHDSVEFRRGWTIGRVNTEQCCDCRYPSEGTLKECMEVHDKHLHWQLDHRSGISGYIGYNPCVEKHVDSTLWSRIVRESRSTRTWRVDLINPTVNSELIV